jgi:hypothetical protein
LSRKGSSSFLKRQKEQQRTARAAAKRSARQSRRDNRNPELATEVPDEASPVEATKPSDEPDVRQ